MVRAHESTSLAIVWPGSDTESIVTDGAVTSGFSGKDSTEQDRAWVCAAPLAVHSATAVLRPALRDALRENVL